MKICFRVSALALLLCTACAGMRPNPRYKSEDSSAAAEEDRTDGYPAAAADLGPRERKLQRQIQSYLGVPYRWGGTTSRGMDCSGFVSVVFKNAFGMQLPHNARKMFALGFEVPRERLSFGDLVFFKNIENRGVSHVGIYLGGGKFAHASTTRGVVISKLTESYYSKRYIGGKRMRRE